MSDVMKTDLRLSFDDTGVVDIVLDSGGAEAVDGLDNLVQALTMRLLVRQGELDDLGHPRHGSRIHELIGEPLDRANLELLRRFVRQALLSDPRVEEVMKVTARAREDVPGVVEIEAAVRAITGEPVELAMALDLG
ncbi:DUF2634 domain-containing protein [Vitiosangium sp. GDMCC 1.1324]|uniref:DUF2634 domain-containing protein n=1 Tax=Vitiosangium sp. (strain GDMCC 1.1324) TaxID=2138576 RepID=UPI000D33DF6E|nr:DUF2634 domain-containing protein [Vitiosangium sp. GDMCC 1.1324]PTL80165.1 DUF2634 domain-containing protein [Vitiosangium sp. GDMCC 1.1324]